MLQRSWMVSAQHNMPSLKTGSRGRHRAEWFGRLANWEKTTVMSLHVWTYCHAWAGSPSHSTLRHVLSLSWLCPALVSVESPCCSGKHQTDRNSLFSGAACQLSWDGKWRKGKERKKKGKQSPGLFGTTSGYQWKGTLTVNSDLDCHEAFTLRLQIFKWNVCTTCL